MNARLYAGTQLRAPEKSIQVPEANARQLDTVGVCQIPPRRDWTMPESMSVYRIGRSAGRVGSAGRIEELGNHPLPVDGAERLDRTSDTLPEFRCLSFLSATVTLPHYRDEAKLSQS